MKRCRHCNGNIVRYWCGLTCLQCGRAPDHRCDARCRELKARPQPVTQRKDFFVRTPIHLDGIDDYVTIPHQWRPL